MIAYRKSWLNSLYIRGQAEEAFHETLISGEERNNIFNKYPAAFYTPNIFIRIGMFLLTAIVMMFSFGLLSLLVIENIDKIIGSLSIFFAFLAYAALEIIVHKKKHYKSGVDDALLWGSALTLFFAISLENNFDGLSNCLLGFIITLYCTLRFADRLMAIFAYISLLGIVFYMVMRTGPGARAIIPFVIMGVSGAAYFMVKRLSKAAIPHVYSDCLMAVEIFSLITFYIGGNYGMVRELGTIILDVQLQPGESIPFGWLFWIFTIFIPLLYIFRGVQKKDVILIRMGLLMGAGVIFTIRYYNSIAPVEIWMVTVGAIMIAFAYVLIRYLHEPKHGFTFKEMNSRHILDNLNVESLVLAETFSGVPAPEAGTKFGGGSFGGGGASGDF